MGFLDRLLGREPQSRPAAGQPGWGGAASAPAPTGAPYAAPGADPYAVPAPRGGASTEDERAIARYRYLLRTAPPEDLERVHSDAFAQLSPEQRQMVLQRLTEDLPESERPRSDAPADLARSATRAELRRPGYLQGAFAGGGRGMGGGMGMGGMIAGSMLGTIAGVVVGSVVADALFDGFDQSPEAAQAGEGDGSADASDSGDAGGAGDTGGDVGAGDAGGDVAASGEGFGGGDLGDWGGGGDLGGDFGGGDFGGFGDF
ncbi:hypothetical protein [Intrasporangium flavum]|uniref:hypothetical protein n=1 Tax=Intrasporangium flavum TaxID=1428657 RepID=UPI00096EA35C|nr:hypothetical protein [Intrasporangium flavum]